MCWASVQLTEFKPFFAKIDELFCHLDKMDPQKGTVVDVQLLMTF